QGGGGQVRPHDREFAVESRGRARAAALERRFVLQEVCQVRRVWKCGVLACAIAVAQQHEMKPPAEKPVVLYKGLGSWKHPIQTRNAEAQKCIDQGLMMLFWVIRYQ